MCVGGGGRGVSTKHCFSKTIKMIGCHACLRDVLGQSYSLHACTCANLACYSSLFVGGCCILQYSSWIRNIVYYRKYLGKNLAGRKCQGYGTISERICGKITPYEMT